MHVSVRAAVLVSLSLALSSCASVHAALAPLPEPTAPLATRVAAYDRLKPRATFPVPIYNTTGAMPQSLILSDGTIVDDPRDLQTAVAPGAATVVHADKCTDAEGSARIWSIVSIATVSTGAAATVGLFGAGLASSDFTRDQIGPTATTLLMSSAAASLIMVLGAIAVVPMVDFQLEASKERAASYASFDRDLRARLHLEPSDKALADQWRDAE